MIHAFILILSVLFVSNVVAEGNQLPPEIRDYIYERNLCEHFRGESHEGDSPDQIERRKFVFESLEIYCAGTDRRLAALKRRYLNNIVVMDKLNIYEEQAEGVKYIPNN